MSTPKEDYDQNKTHYQIVYTCFEVECVHILPIWSIDELHFFSNKTNEILFQNANYFMLMVSKYALTIRKHKTPTMNSMQC